MTKNHIQNARRKNLRRRRRGKKRRIIGFTATSLILFIVAVGLSGKAAFEREKPSELSAVTAVDKGTEAKRQLVLVNKWNPLPKDCQPELVEVKGGERVDSVIYEPLMRMLEDAKEANWNQTPRVVSGFRTADKQQKLYDEKIEKYKKDGYSADEAKELAEQWVAVPGYSEHQLGLAVDINGATYDVYLWLQENSYKYGFIFRYPESKTEITGVAEEVWHYRYVGIEAAKEMYEQGLCLEEYLNNN